MPDGYVLNIWVLMSDFCNCMLQSVRETLLISFEIGPASIELVFTMAVLYCSVKVQDILYVGTYKRLPIVVDD